MKRFKGKSITDEGVLKEIAERFRKDDRFRTTLRRDPEAVLEDLGIVIPGGLQLEVKGDTAETECLCLAPLEELSDEDIRMIVGGVSMLNPTNLQGLQTRSMQSVRLAGAVMYPLYGI